MIVAQMPRTIELDAAPFEGVAPAGLEQGVIRTTEEEFRDIVETYSGSAYQIALRMLHNTADAEDAVQEAFISAYRAYSNFKGQSKVTTWLYRIVVNSCLMKIRKEPSQKLRVTVSEPADNLSFTILYPPDGLEVSDATVPLVGVTQPNAVVGVNEVPVEAHGVGIYSTTVDLQEGDNFVEVLAADIEGHVRYESVTVFL